MERIETEGHIHTFRDGIIHVYVKPTPPSLDTLQQSLDVMRARKNGGKILVLIDPRDAVTPNTAQRKLSSREFNTFVDAVAMINTNTFTTMILRMVLKFDSPKFPLRVFKTEKEATLWLKSFYDDDDRTVSRTRIIGS